MNYPFEFEEIPLTSTMLDRLGAEWWGGAGDFCDGAIPLGIKSLRLHLMPEELDDSYGYGTPIYQAEHFVRGSFRGPMYFLHELYEEAVLAGADDEFIEKCKEINLMPFIESYLKFKHESIS